MRSVIQQSVVLPAPVEQLFEMYLDPVIHAAVTGFPATIDCVAGAEFRAFGDQLTGNILAVERPRLIVQSWRSTKFDANDPDSTLILSFSGAAEQGSGRIDLVHLDVSEHDYQDVVIGWEKYYWTPWRSYLAAQKGKS
jgi:activator of HSP90 ATPase